MTARMNVFANTTSLKTPLDSHVTSGFTLIIEEADSMYRVGEMATMTGVTVRTLRHYDSLGLVRPTERTEGGHRVYSKDDLLRLQHAIALRSLEFPLKRIREMLERPDFDIAAALSAQKKTLDDRIKELEQARDAVADLLDDRKATGKWSVHLAATAALAIQQNLKERGETLEKYYTEEQMGQFEQLGNEVPSTKQKEIESNWAKLTAEVEANLSSDPASEEAQSLLARWDELTAEMQSLYAKYPDLWKAIGENYKAGNFDSQPGAPGTDVWAFIEKARKAGPGL